jgi:hypothetical protein
MNTYDKTILNTLRPSDLTAYLRAFDWQEVQRNEKATVWIQRQDNEEFEILLPLQRDVRDFSIRMSEVLSTLSVFEQRSPTAVLNDLKTVTGADVIRVCVQNDTLPLNDGVLLMQHAKNLLLAAACATVDYRAYFAPRKASEVTDYLQKIYLGQTEQGSYVVRLISPVNPQLRYQTNNQLSMFALEPPFERRVVQTLMQSLSALQKAALQASHSSDFTPFQDAVRQGVSANLCEAVYGMSARRYGLDINVTWSYARPPDKQIPNRVLFSDETMHIIDEAGRLFRATSPQESFELEGLVISLHREKENSRGVATIMGFIERRHRKVRVELDEKDYMLAIQAHKENIPVYCEGELVREGRSFILSHPRNFILEPDE